MQGEGRGDVVRHGRIVILNSELAKMEEDLRRQFLHGPVMFPSRELARVELVKSYQELELLEREMARENSRRRIDFLPFKHADPHHLQHHWLH